MSKAHRSLLAIMKSVVHIHFVECSNGALWYQAFCADDIAIQPDWTLLFPVPLGDVAGGVFLPLVAGTECRYYQRWIRKELELQKAEEEMIAEAKAEWKP